MFMTGNRATLIKKGKIAKNYTRGTKFVCHLPNDVSYWVHFHNFRLY